MAEYASGLPIRSESDGTDEKVVVKIVDGQVGGSNQMQIDSDKNAHVEIHANDPAAVDRVVKSSESGNIALDGFYNVSTNSIPSSAAHIIATRTATPALSDQIIRRTGIINGSIHAADVSLFDNAGTPYSRSNPLFVSNVEPPVATTEVNDYAAGSSLAAAATSNHDYTVTAGKTLNLSQVEASGSGKLLVAVQIETGVATGVFTTKWRLRTSASTPNASLKLNQEIAVAAGVRVRVALTNEDKQAFDVDSTISGEEF